MGGSSPLPFFQKNYRDEFKRFGKRFVKRRSYREFLNRSEPNDILILTETWPCEKDRIFFRGSGSRQIQYYLTAQDRRFTYDISYLYIPNADPESCGVFTHTHYMTTLFLNQSTKATITPYVTPSIVELAARQKANKDHWKHLTTKKSLILIDGDAGFQIEKFAPELRPRIQTAASIEPYNLYHMYASSLAVVDWAMPGAERLVLEGSLFDTAVVINDEINGVDPVDFPVPKRFRIAGRNYTALNGVLTQIVTAHRDAQQWGKLISEFEPMRSSVASLRPAFYRAVRRFFSDAIHFTFHASVFGAQRDLFSAVVSTLAAMPIASVSIVDPLLERDRSAQWSAFEAFLRTHYLWSSVDLVRTAADIRIPASALFAASTVENRSRACFVATERFVDVVAVNFDLFPKHRALWIDPYLLIHKRDTEELIAADSPPARQMYRHSYVLCSPGFKRDAFPNNPLWRDWVQLTSQLT
jgi:hypothetical protein